MVVDGAEEDYDGQGHNPFMVRHARVLLTQCGLEPPQFTWFRVVVQLYNALTQSNSSTARKTLQAGMQLSSWCDDCWSYHILSAMNGLTQS